MLKRCRIEVEGADSAAACEEELAKYEHVLQVAEADRYLANEQGQRAVIDRQREMGWDAAVAERSFFNGELGRAVTDEVIEYDASLPGYRGRRVIAFRRADTRHYTFGRADDPEMKAAQAADLERVERGDAPGDVGPVEAGGEYPEMR